jgi:lysophospholipase L1-like esterase
MAQVPVWAFHGQADTVVAPARSRAMIEALRRAGASPRYTEYPGVRHDSWTRTYRDPAVHAWLFAQRRASGVAPVALRHGDRIAFFGDSITAAGARGKGFIRLIEADLKRRLPDFGVALIGAGVSGNKVADLQQRLQRDVLDQRPTIVVIYIGINDVWHWNEDRGTSPAAFESGLRDLLARITKAGARVVLCTPTVIGEQADGTNRFDQMLDRYAAISRQVARSTGTQVLDLRRRLHAAGARRGAAATVLTGQDAGRAVYLCTNIQPRGHSTAWERRRNARRRSTTAATRR